ncbi:hypothetical protein B0H10DRAFT_1990495 [Mycena sp. CBHHK59/15]|nr:hypothetical protein B0H10DRAFT_1990495 [Mycena sp. CBHHK59/15]
MGPDTKSEAKTASLTCLHISDVEATLDPSFSGQLFCQILIDRKARCKEPLNGTTSLQFRPLQRVVRFHRSSTLTVQFLRKSPWWKRGPSVSEQEISFGEAIEMIKAANGRSLRERLVVTLVIKLKNGALLSSLKASVDPRSPSLQVCAIDVALSGGNVGRHYISLLDGGVNTVTYKLTRTQRWDLEPPFMLQNSRSLSLQISSQKTFALWLRKQLMTDIFVSYSDVRAALEATTSPSKPYLHKIDSAIPVVLSVTSDDLRSVIDEAEATARKFNTDILERLGVSRELLDRMFKYSTAISEIHPVAKTLVGLCSGVYEEFKARRQCDALLLELTRDMVDALDCVTDVRRFSRPDSPQAQTLEEAMISLEGLVSDATNQDLKYNSGGGSTDQRRDKVEKLRRKFRNFIEQFQRRVPFLATANLENAMDQFMCQRFQTSVENLKPPGQEKERPRPCLDGTRSEVLKQIRSWVSDLSTPNILWLTGFPGSGKTSIAWSLVVELTEPAGRGPHFFFRADTPTYSTTSNLWLTVAAHLASRYPMFGKLVMDNVDKRRATTSAEIFRYLISDPTKRVDNAVCVAVVDAIDECSASDGVAVEETAYLLSSLAKWSDLPSSFKIIVTSRNDIGIGQVLRPISHNIQLNLEGESAAKDINLFLEAGFQKIAAHHGRTLLLDEWPGPTVIRQLTQKAGGLFIYAKTLLSFLEQDSEKRLKRILNGDIGTEGPIFDLYQRILDTSFLQVPEKPDTDDIRTALGAIISSRVPLTFDEYVTCVMPNLSVPNSAFDNICRRLRSVLDNEKPDELVRFHHQSFVEFLASPSCPVDLRIETRTQRIKITLAYLRTLRRELVFNICDLQSGNDFNRDIDDLASRIEEHILPPLSYAAAHWADQLGLLHADPLPPDIKAEIKAFLETKFLYWLEVCSLTNNMQSCLDQLSALRKWAEGDQELKPLAKDAYRFVKTSKEVISRSIPHIYLSAVPFTRRSSKIFQIYKRRLAGIVGVTMPAKTSLITRSQHTKPITCVVFSPDGKCIASASRDGTIGLWTANGIPQRKPLIGHTRSVLCVAFSPDGCRLVSGSRDCTARVWDVSKGEQLATFTGHVGFVTGVVFTGPFAIASVSRDGTLRVWKSTAEREYFHSDALSRGSPMSVASLGGRKLVVCSEDSQMLLVNIVIRHGDNNASSQGHGETQPVPISTVSSITCVSSSSDGKWFVTGDKEATVTVWDTASKQEMHFMYGHSDTVTSVAVNDKRIASSSRDGTICIWDAESGQLLLGSLRRADPIGSVAFSPNGIRLISGSENATLRVLSLSGLRRGGTSMSESFHHYELRDGWIYDRDGKLILWVPTEHHTSFIWLGTTAVVDTQAVCLEFSRLSVGKRWIDCHVS